MHSTIFRKSEELIHDVIEKKRIRFTIGHVTSFMSRERFAKTEDWQLFVKYNKHVNKKLKNLTNMINLQKKSKKLLEQRIAELKKENALLKMRNQIY